MDTPKHDITPIAAIYSCVSKTTGTNSPAAQLLNEEKDVKFSPIFVAAACVALYDSFENFVRESGQNDFEKYFKLSFDELFEQRSSFINHIDVSPQDDL